MITTLTLNPALDRTVKTGTISFGEVNRVGDIREDLGGKGINVGRILTGFNCHVVNVTILGEANRKAVMDYFHKDHMTVQEISVPGRTRTNMVLVEEELNRTTNINESGVVVNEENIQAVITALKELVADSDYLIMSGSVPTGVPVDIYAKLTQLYGDRLRVVLDADGELLTEGLKAHPFMIKPNIHELENALGCELEDTESIRDAARKIIDTYGVTYVLVSMGGDGSLLVSKDVAYHCAAIPTTILSTVGAGDSMVAGFVYGLEKEMHIKDALAFAVACATKTISVDGYPQLDLDTIEGMRQQAIITSV